MDSIVGVEDVEAFGFVNHAVTLMRNGRTLKNVSSIDCGNEFFIDPRFRPITPLFWLQQVLDTLFGTDTDRAYFTVRMWTLLRALNDAGLITQYLTIWPRTTYDLDGSSLLTAAYGTNRIQAVVESGYDAPTITVIGDLQADNGRGRLLQDWLISVTGSDITVMNTLDGTKRVYATTLKKIPLHSVSFKNDLLHAFFSTPDANVPPGQYTISGLARPTEDMSDIETRLLALGNETLDALFDNSQMPITDGQQLFYKNKSVLFRVAGAVLATVYHLDALKRGPVVTPPKLLPVIRLDAWQTDVHWVLPPVPQPDFDYAAPAGLNRMMLIMLGMELNDEPDAHIISVTYGGKPMIRLVHDRIDTTYTYLGQGYSEIWGLDEAGIQAAVGTTIHVNYGTIFYNHVTLAHAIATFENVDQLESIISFDSDKCGGSHPGFPADPAYYCDRPLVAAINVEPGAMLLANVWSGHENNIWGWTGITKRADVFELPNPPSDPRGSDGDSMGLADSTGNNGDNQESYIDDDVQREVVAFVDKLTIRQVMVAISLRANHH